MSKVNMIHKELFGARIDDDIFDDTYEIRYKPEENGELETPKKSHSQEIVHVLCEGVYFGPIGKEGLPEGLGCYIFMDKSYYLGNVYQGLFHGEGIYVHENQDYYKGKWAHNEANGHG